MPENVPENEYKAKRISRMMATAVLSSRKGAMDEASIDRLSNAIMKRPAFGMLVNDERSEKLMRSNRGTDLCALFFDKEKQLKGPQGPYSRPASLARDDASFLKAASGSTNDGKPASGSPAEIERESKLLSELNRRIDHARSLLEKGIPLSEKDSAGLVTAAKRYNDGGTSVPGGRREAPHSKEAMCILARYMPEQEFNDYCRGINTARGANKPTDRGRVEPADYTPKLLTGSVRPARELMNETRKRLLTKMTVDECATAAAIHKLSRGNPNALISKDALEIEVASYKKPGSAFMQVMQDSKAKAKFAELASRGLSGKLGSTIIDESRKASARSAQWQIDQAAAAAGAGRGTKETIAEMLAAKELMQSSDPSSAVTNDAFKDRVKDISASAAFQKLAQRYDSDPGYRKNMDRELASGDRNNAVQKAYERTREATAEKTANVPTPEY